MVDSPIFTRAAFDLLAGIRLQPTAGFYHDHREEFKTFIEQPFQDLFKRAGARLPAMMRNRLETQKNLFGRILKNDFGQGGAWSSYWGAFYPRDSRRIADVQLAVWMNADLLQISFYIGDYGLVPRARFRENCQRFQTELLDLLSELVDHPRLVAERWGRGTGRVSWEDWLAAHEPGDYLVRLPIEPEQVLCMPGSALEALIVKTHSLYFPLAILAMEPDPLPWIRRYLDVGG